jgi:hypothetical protein
MCGNDVCDTGETTASCPQDCDTCGNDKCDSNETATSCPQDCDTCGNSVCDTGETTETCPGDCPICGNSQCEAGETVTSCAQDCTASLIVQNASFSHIIDGLYVYSCTAPVEGGNLMNGQLLFPGESGTVSAILPGCYLFHATALDGVEWRSSTGSQLAAGTSLRWKLGE